MFNKRDKILIVSEIHPQHGADMSMLKTYIMQSKMYGADAVKVQLYTSQTLFGDDRKKHMEISFDELNEIKEYADLLNIDIFASVFDEEKLEWCESLGFKYHKIASKMVKDESLCKKIIATGKPTMISTREGRPYEAENLTYLYCVPEYPTMLCDLDIPKTFSKDEYYGYSDHSLGLTACKVAISRGAKIIEKHFTISKNIQHPTERGHLGGMTFEDLLELRRFANEYVLLK
jgi:sialic acid synthase SpsE|tara:strand:+ start:425 stop:1120 length:696 start_codon:yes stop_codon:yes gene_type:complete